MMSGITESGVCLLLQEVPKSTSKNTFEEGHIQTSKNCNPCLHQQSFSKGARTVLSTVGSTLIQSDSEKMRALKKNHADKFAFC